MLYDSHAHLTCETLLPMADHLVEEARQAGVTRILVIATDSVNLAQALALQERFPEEVRVAAATTPHDVVEEGSEAGERFYAEVCEAAHAGKLAAIGESGLDLYNAETPLVLQKAWLRRYLQLAKQVERPIVLHCRNSFPELIEMLTQEYRDEAGGYGKGGVVHCFTGNVQEAQSLLERGFFLSISGILTYKKNDEFRHVVKQLPLDKLLLETDCPYLAPQSRRGKVNVPAYMVETAMCLAQVHGVSFAEVQRITTANAVRLFG